MDSALIKIKQAREQLEKAAREYERLTVEHFNLGDVFLDRNFLTLKVIEACNAKGYKIIALSAREGNDAMDEFGNEIEIKTKSFHAPAYATSPKLNKGTLARYRKVPYWIFASFHKYDIETLHIVESNKLSPYFDSWEQKFNGKKISHRFPTIFGETIEEHIMHPVDRMNNPTIPHSFVSTVGQTVINTTYDTLESLF